MAEGRTSGARQREGWAFLGRYTAKRPRLCSQRRKRRVATWASGAEGLGALAPSYVTIYRLRPTRLREPRRTRPQRTQSLANCELQSVVQTCKQGLPAEDFLVRRAGLYLSCGTKFLYLVPQVFTKAYRVCQPPTKKGLPLGVLDTKVVATCTDVQLWAAKYPVVGPVS